MTDAKFLREQLALIRELAEKADPYIRTRLLALAEKYERRLADQNRATQSRF
ncbi:MULTISPECIES: hypothetical protein [Bradyrhizobium]|uniref:Uncharacterized protein n=1 Tax=Bradyrhizobium symbiodeficiens TaxID=1404367 RepID=A0A6G9ABS1_9BRAD|nr:MULTISPECIES: hypothetical protein [Bradyrhizobium]QIP00630.1 hypothetical protein HAU86_12815 [Bradyrhizobium symbiodeficiens]QIP09745.1 hypothetical protein HAV00_27440 [Bradyrhizobium symbiodeficiens]UPJ55158.1 hypothetical protein IVB24_20965 [Bradyrhizobium sp. 192]